MERRFKQHKNNKNANVFTRILGGAKTFIDIVKRMNWLGRGLLIGLVLLIACAVVMPIVLLNDETVVFDNLEPMLPIPTPVYVAKTEPTRTPIPTTEPEPTFDPVLERGDDSNDVQVLQERLMELGYMEIDDSTSFYGPVTKHAVELFQRQHGLQQDGIAGYETQAMIFSPDAKKYTLLEGTKGTDVDAMQQQLVALGYMDTVTGYYGTVTVESVKEFQGRNDLKTDGKTGEKTLDLLYSPNAVPSASKIQEERRRANIDEMIAVAQKQLGEPYIRGHSGPNSFDCSGLVYYCLKQAGSSRGRYNAAGYAKVDDWQKIDSYDDLKRGDLLFFWSSSRGKIGHVGIYVGNDMMIDASSSNGKVVYRSCTTPYWIKTFRWARRPW